MQQLRALIFTALFCYVMYVLGVLIAFCQANFTYSQRRESQYQRGGSRGSAGSASRKWGCRAGGVARLWEQPHKPALPSLSLANVRSLENKMDKLRLQAASDNFSRLLCPTHHQNMSTFMQPDPATKLAFFTIWCFNRTSDSGKNQGGGLCMYINNNWCNNTGTVASHCSPDLEYLTVPTVLPTSGVCWGHANCCLHFTGC